MFRKKGRAAGEWFELGYREEDPEEKVEYYAKALDISRGIRRT